MSETHDHEWHMFDEEKGYEVYRAADKYWVRRHGEVVCTLTPEEFDQWRSEGPNPKELE